MSLGWLVRPAARTYFVFLWTWPGWGYRMTWLVDSAQHHLKAMMASVVTVASALASLNDCVHVYDFAEAFFGRGRQS
jgi:hypothetical protein